jgi:ABC-type Zn uptake system ZnuABC Zn-binding protein ZnuA
LLTPLISIYKIGNLKKNLIFLIKFYKKVSMKVKIECDSPLLQKSLEYFLKDYLDENGVVITDNPEKEGIIIGKDIIKPFSKTTLLLQLEKLVDIKPNFEEEFDKLFDEFKEKLKKLIKDYYGKR